MPLGESAAIATHRPIPNLDHWAGTGQLRSLRSVDNNREKTWAQRLKRVFNIDIEIYRKCGGAVKVITCIEDPVVIDKILTHLKEKTTEAVGMLPEVRAPPQKSLFY